MSANQPEFSDLHSPSPMLIKELVKGARKGYITFHRKDILGNHSDIAAVPVDCFPTMFDELVEDLSSDGYASVNLFFRRGHGYADRELFDTKGNRIHRPYRRIDAVSRLTAVWADIDCYHHDITEGQAIGALWDAQADGRIPPPSALQSSGRGVWVFWFLNEPKAFPEHVALHRAINRHLQKLFEPIGADASATDAARICRVAGSLNTKSSNRVNVAILGNRKGVPRYKLADLAAQFEIVLKQTPYRRITAGPVNEVNKLKGIKGRAARWQLDEQRFWHLVKIREDGIREGTRHDHVFVLGSILRHRYRDEDQRTKAVDAAAVRLCRSFATRRDYSLSQVTKELRRVAFDPAIGRKGLKQITAEEIARRLKITENEAQAIAELTSRPIHRSWPSMFGPAPAPLKQADAAARRRQWITDHRDLVHRMTCRQLADTLTAAGLPCSPTTAAKDMLAAIGPKVTSRDLTGQFENVDW